MSSSSPPIPETCIEYTSLGVLRRVRVRAPLPQQAVQGTVALCTGSIMIGLDTSRPMMSGLEDLADQLESALLAENFAVVRPLDVGENYSAEELVITANDFLDVAFKDSDHHSLIGFSAAGPLMMVAAAERELNSMVLVAPPILETFSNHPERVEHALIDQLGLPAETASHIGSLEPMSKSSESTSSALLIHGAADSIVSSDDSIGWRASMAAAGIQARRVEIAFAEHDLSPEPCKKIALDTIVNHIVNTT